MDRYIQITAKLPVNFPDISGERYFFPWITSGIVRLYYFII